MEVTFLQKQTDVIYQSRDLNLRVNTAGEKENRQVETYEKRHSQSLKVMDLKGKVQSKQNYQLKEQMVKEGQGQSGNQGERQGEEKKGGYICNTLNYKNIKN